MCLSNLSLFIPLLKAPLQQELTGFSCVLMELD